MFKCEVANCAASFSKWLKSEWRKVADIFKTMKAVIACDFSREKTTILLLVYQISEGNRKFDY